MAKDKTKSPKSPTPVDDEFGGPGQRSEFRLADYVGALILFTPKSVESMDTQYGESNPTKSDVVVLTNSKGKVLDEPLEADGVLIFQRVINSQLESSVGTRRVLGTIGKGTAKKGQSEPYLIVEPTDADKAIARAYLAALDPFKA